MKIRSTRYLALVFAFVLTITTCVNNNADAAIAQCGTRQNSQIGWGTAFHSGAQPVGGAEGVSSFIYSEPVALCTTDQRPKYNFSTSWNMIYKGAGNYVQAGYIFRATYNCAPSWTEQSTGGHFRDWNYHCVTPGSRHAFQNLAVFTNGNWHIRSTVDGHLIHLSTFSPFAWNSPEPRNIAFTGETYYGESDVMGTPSKKTAYTAMGVQRYDNNALVSTCGHAYLGTYTNGFASRYAVDSLACDYVRTWTK